MSSSQTGILTGARLAVDALEQSGVGVVFGLPGVHNLALWRALGESPVRLVGVRHEQTAAYAADGYARASGRVGVALTTTGPGAANTLGALGEAWASRQPVVVIATDIPTRLRRPGVWRGVLHEATDQAAMFEPVTKETIRVRSAAQIGRSDRSRPRERRDSTLSPGLRGDSHRSPGRGGGGGAGAAGAVAAAPARRRGAARSGRADGGELTPAAYLGRRRGPAGREPAKRWRGSPRGSWRR